jgi:thiamine biosynthesis protein ThiS
MLTISVNGESRQIPEQILLSDFLKTLLALPPMYAVAVNGVVLQRQQYAQCRLDHGDVIDIVAMVGGG